MKFGKKAAHSGAKRSLVLVVSVLVLLLAVAGGTLAWLTAQDSVTNTFSPAHVTCDVAEDNFTGDTKSNVAIKNTSDIPVYIRAYIVVTWKDRQGNVCGQVPVEGTNYEMSINLNKGWTQSGDYWYCKTAIAPGEFTPVLINSCASKNNAPDDNYNLSVEIIAEAIQSVPDTAVQDAWGVVPSSLANN